MSITLREPALFWEKWFGTAPIVPWEAFASGLQAHFGLAAITDISDDLKGHVDMTKDGRVSWWEFCVFTRLYQPWERILNTWRLLTKGHPGYQAWMTYEEVQQLLQPLVGARASCIDTFVMGQGVWST